MDITFENGELLVYDDKGKRVIGVVTATVYLNDHGRTEAMLYVNVDHFKGVGLTRGADGVRAG